MLYALAGALVALWLLGLLTSYTLGGFIHVLLVTAIIIVVLRLLRRSENTLIAAGIN
jgi:hypothetical protein